MRRHVLFFFVFLLCVTVTQVLLAQDTPMRYDFGAETAQANAIQLMGPGFSQDEANRASIEFGPIPTDQAFADATDGTGAMITAQPGQGILILGQPIRVGKAAMMRCSIRADWKTAFPILGALDADLYEAGGGDFLITTTINNGNHVWGRYRRMTVFFTPPTSGFIPLIQVVNKSKTNSVRIFIDNLDIYLLEPDRFYRGDFLNGDEDDPAITSASIHNFVRTPIPTPSFTPSHTPTPSQTSTPTHTPLPTHTPTPTLTPSQTPTWTFTPTYTFTNTPTYTPTLTHTPTPTVTPSPTTPPTPTFTPTPIQIPDITQLNILDPEWRYMSPYLIECRFALRDAMGEPIITHPSVFQLEAREDKAPVSRTEHGLRLSGAQNQLTETVMVMDYSLSMADIPANGDENNNGISDAIEAMEAAAKTLIDSLNAGARVGAYEFHREEEPNRVFPFVTDKQYAKEQIDSIMDNYIHGFHDLSRVWDAVYAAVHEFDEWATNKENRFVVFFSDGRDESSKKLPEDIIQAANNRNVTVYAIGFGGEVNETPLKNITAQTGGRYFAAREKNAFLTHIQQIQHDLQGYYTMRWATLKRNDESFTPSFTISLNNLSDTAAAPKNAYNVMENAGDPLIGRLQFVGSDVVAQKTTVFLRADYVPRSVRRIKWHFHSDYPYTASLVSAASGGLVADWGMQITQAESSGAQWIEIVSSDPTDRLTSIPFAAFGSLIRFDFTHIPPNIGVEEILGTNRDIYVDNTIYENTGGQSFVINNIPGVSTVRVPLDLPADAQPLELIRIPAGTFTMGSPQSEKDRQNDEGPPHPVKISQQFYLGKYEITQAQWKAVMGYNPSANGDKPNFPVETISWEDTQDFLQELNKLNLGYFRLPTEAEWEYACRAGSTARFHFGDDAFYSRINSHAWNRQNAGEESHEVGFKSPNAWNLFDMTGNVWEWCKDWKDAYTAAKQIDPTGPASGSAKVIRGGAFDYHPKYCRSAARNGFNPKLRFPNTGFRVLMEKR